MHGVQAHVLGLSPHMRRHFPDVEEPQGGQPSEHCENRGHAEGHEDKADPQVPAEGLQEREGIYTECPTCLFSAGSLGFWVWG